MVGPGGGKPYGRPEKSAKTGRAECGVAYLGLLFAVALAGIALAGTGTLWQMEAKREKEKQLLFAGEAYRRAIVSYRDASPGAPEYPPRLADLLLDPRFPMPVRHLRQPYPDPLRADGKWELIRQDGRIVGVASRSPEEPLKIADFPEAQAAFEGARRYADWRFMAHGGGRARSRRAADATD